MVQPFPAPSLRELLSAAKLRECSSMNVSTQKFQSLYALVGNHWHGGTIGGHSLSQPLRAASSLREGAGMGAYHSMCRSETARLRAIFIAPTEALVILPFTVQPGACETVGGGRFSSPLRKAFAVHWGVLSRVNWYFIISVWRSRCMTPSAILRMSRDATKAMVFSASSRGTL